MPGGRATACSGGATWRPVGIDSVKPWKYTRALLRLRDDVLLLGGGDRPPGWQGAIARSGDGGRTWARVLPELANSTVWNFAAHPADVGDRGVVEVHHFRSSRIVLPTRTWTPRPIVVGCVMRTGPT